MAELQNTITLHLDSNAASEWMSEDQAGWDTRFTEGCDDVTRQRRVPVVGDVGELPWSTRTSGPPNDFIIPISSMTGVRFEPLDLSFGIEIPNFLQPYYSWGIRGVWLGKAQTEDRLVFGDYVEILFDSAESRQSFKEEFGENITIQRTGINRKDITNPVLINQSRDYSSADLRETEITIGPGGVWGPQSFFMLSYKERPVPNPVPNPSPDQPIKDAVESRVDTQISTIIDITFTSATGAEDIMGTCDNQQIDRCKPIEMGDCIADSDCNFCNSKCVNGTCICEDCPCYSICVSRDPETNGFVLRDLIDGDVSNCSQPGCPDPQLGTFLCDCQTPGQLVTTCRPERDIPNVDPTINGSSCDCQDIPFTVCCENVQSGTFACCSQQEFGDFGPGGAVVRCIDGFGCGQTECAVDADCNQGDCVFCQLDGNGVGTCTPREDGSSCGDDPPGCFECLGAECTSTESDDCNCSYNTCPDGTICCSFGTCCPEEFGCGSGSGCDQCDNDADCPTCEQCVQQSGGNRCTVTDCDPCFTRQFPECVCNIPFCRECEDCGSIAGNPVCTENCGECSRCGPSGKCQQDIPGGDCRPDEIKVIPDDGRPCFCEPRCPLDCHVWNGIECEVSGCECCEVCSGSPPGECSGPNDGLCAGNAECIDCQCITVGCPDCSLVGGGCLVCDESTFTCVPPQTIGEIDGCGSDCEECQLDGNCGNSSCIPPSTCCGDINETCCPPGEKCCPKSDGTFFCADQDLQCCGDGGACDNNACLECVDGTCRNKCQECQGCDGAGNCTGESCNAFCETCEDLDGDGIPETCVPDPTQFCELNFCTPPGGWCQNCTLAANCEGICECDGLDCFCSNNPDWKPGQPTPQLFACENCTNTPSGFVGNQTAQPEIPGACCLENGICTEQLPSACADLGGFFSGGSCTPNPCNS